MTVLELKEKLGMETVSEGDMMRSINDCYLCDMLSYDMAKAKEGDAWITVQTNMNVVAVASLADCACVIIPENIVVEAPTAERARAQNVTILRASQTAFDIAYEIGKNIKGGGN